MKTTLDIVTILYTKIKGSALEAAISGGLYKYQRPTDSTVEDIVVNVITTDAEMIQRGSFNVNIHVPKAPDGMPNSARLSALSSIAAPLLIEGYGEKYNFWIESQSIFQDEDNWYTNFRIRVNYHNTF